MDIRKVQLGGFREVDQKYPLYIDNVEGPPFKAKDSEGVELTIEDLSYNDSTKQVSLFVRLNATVVRDGIINLESGSE